MLGGNWEGDRSSNSRLAGQTYIWCWGKDCSRKDSRWLAQSLKPSRPQIWHRSSWFTRCSSCLQQCLPLVRQRTFLAHFLESIWRTLAMLLCLPWMWHTWCNFNAPPIKMLRLKWPWNKCLYMSCNVRAALLTQTPTAQHLGKQGSTHSFPFFPWLKTHCKGF